LKQQTAWYWCALVYWFEREFFGSAKSLSGFSNQGGGGVLVDVFAVLLITNYFVFFASICLTQQHFGSILAE